MRSNVVRVLVGIALIVVAIVLLVVLKDTDSGTGDSGSESGEGIVGPAGRATGGGAGPAEGAARIPTIVVKDGEPVGGVRRLEYSAGEQIRFEVESDVADEVHIHGYDLMKDVKAGGSVGFDFPATIEGVFEGELESRGEQILELRVIP
jgi:hypothetical protein